MIPFFWLLVGHYVCDYPLQGDFLARGKNHRNPIAGVPAWQCLIAHAVIQGGAVALITGNVTLGIGEAIAHGVIDYAKSDGFITFNEDQLLHVLCKFVWASVGVPVE